MKRRNKDIKSCYTTRELASLLNTSESVIYDYNASGFKNFPRGFKWGQQWRWKPEDIDAWITEQQQQQVEETTQEATPTQAKTDTKQKATSARLECFAHDMYILLLKLAVEHKDDTEIFSLLERISR